MKKENIYKQLRENTETIARPALTQGELAAIFEKEGNPLSQSVISKLENQQKEPPTTSPDVIKAYATHFNVTADYLLGIRDNAIADENLAMIGSVTGLSDKSIQVLKKWNSLKKEPMKIATTYGNGDLEMLNLILEDYYDLSNRVAENGYIAWYSIFHFIRSYIFSDLFKREPQDRIRYRHGTRWDDIKIGDIHQTDTESNVIEQLNAIGKSGASSYSEKLHIYNTENEQETYTVDFQALYKNLSRQHIIEAIDKIKERIDKKNEVT